MKLARTLRVVVASLRFSAAAMAVGGLAGAATMAASASASAQELSAEVTERCVRATVKVMAVDAEGHGASGSGSIIDPRGYVLTNYHVVARIAPGQGGPVGSLFSPSGNVTLALSDSARSAARPRYLGQLVRVDPVLDLALIRIVSDADGHPLTERTFPFVPMATTQHLRPGARVYAFGYPLDVRTINVTAGAVTGFQMNGRDEVAWIRTDARFNHGNSGGMLVDTQGHLVAIPTAVRSGSTRAANGERLLEPIELARPVERIPADWLHALRTGSLGEAQITGVQQLRPGQPLSVTVVGDGTVSDADREQRFYGVPAQRPALVRVNPTLPIAVMDVEGHVLREGQGQVAVSEADPAGSLISVLVPRASSRSVSFTINAEANAPANVGYAANDGASLIPVGPARGQPAGPTQVQPVLVDTAAPLGAGGAAVPPVGGGLGQAALGPQPAAPLGDNVMVRASVVDGATSTPIAGAMVIIGRAGTDVTAAVGQLLAGRITEAQFDTMMVASTRTDAAGRYQFPALPRGQRYAEFIMARGFRPMQLALPIDDSSPALLELSPIQLTH